MSEHTPGQGRHLADPQFPDDDGMAKAEVRLLLAAHARGEIDATSVARALRGERLLATVIAVLDDLDEKGGDKDSHMAVVSMVNSAGDKGMLAFTGVDAIEAWNTEGRPVPALGRDLARAALEDDAQALVLDVAGPYPTVLAGPLLAALAAEVDLAHVESLVMAALAPLTSDGWVEVTVAGIDGPEAAADVLVLVSARQGAHPDGRSVEQLAQQAARVLAGRSDLHRLVPGGVAVLPSQV